MGWHVARIGACVLPAMLLLATSCAPRSAAPAPSAPAPSAAMPDPVATADSVTLIVVEQPPRPDAIALISVDARDGRTRNTITIARNDVSRASVYTAIMALKGFRDARRGDGRSAMFVIRADHVPDEHRMSVESRKYVEYYLHHLSTDDGPPTVVIPLRARR